MAVSTARRMVAWMVRDLVVRARSVSEGRLFVAATGVLSRSEGREESRSRIGGVASGWASGCAAHREMGHAEILRPLRMPARVPPSTRMSVPVR